MFIKTDNSYIFIINNETVIIKKGSLHFNEVEEYLKNNSDNIDYDYILKCSKEIKDDIVKIVNVDNEVIKFENDRILIDLGDTLYRMTDDNSLIKKIISDTKKGVEVNYLKNFLIKALKNPNKEVVKYIYEFVSASNISIIENGDIICYKVVKNNYKDCHTGTFDNSIGSVVEMARYKVDSDRESTCSNGLHACSLEYVNSFKRSDNIIVMVQISPEDIVAIPNDYNNSKLRCCKYTVIADVKGEIDEESGKDEYEDGPLTEDTIEKSALPYYSNVKDAAKHKDKSEMAVVNGKGKLYHFVRDKSGKKRLVKKD